MEVELTANMLIKISASGGLQQIVMTVAEARELRDYLLAEKSITPSLKALKLSKPPTS